MGDDNRTSRSPALGGKPLRIVNAVPYVIDAPAGELSSLDLPLTVPRNGLTS